MRLEQLNFHHLFYFWHVARSGNLTQSSRELHTSQSALSTQIRQVEERLRRELADPASYLRRLLSDARSMPGETGPSTRPLATEAICEDI